MVGIGGGAAVGAEVEVQASRGGGQEKGWSRSTNHHAEVAVTPAEIPVNGAISADFTSSSGSIESGSERLGVGEMIWLGAGEQVNLTYTFNSPYMISNEPD